MDIKKTFILSLTIVLIVKNINAIEITKEIIDRNQRVVTEEEKQLEVEVDENGSLEELKLEIYVGEENQELLTYIAEIEQKVLKKQPYIKSLSINNKIERILSETNNCLKYNEESEECTECLDGYILNSNKQCIRCGYLCKECNLIEYESTVCIQCYEEKENLPTILFNGKCYYQDTISYNNSLVLRNETNNETLPCPESCIKCYLLNGSFVCQSPQIGFSFIINSTIEVKLCKKNCIQCEGKEMEICVQCSRGFFLTNNTCTRCTEYDGNCAECEYNNNVSCSSCMDSYNSEQNQCIKCGNNCIECYYENSYSYCTKCESGYFLYSPNNNTNQSLLKDYTPQCMECSEDCEQCALNVNEMVCTSCYMGFYLSNYSNTCQRCTEHCLKCTKSSDCQECTSGYGIAFVYDSIYICYKLVPFCEFYEVTYYSSKKCVSCSFGYTLVLGACIKSRSEVTDSNNRTLLCYNNQYLENWECQSPKSLLQNCIKYDKNGCIKCDMGYYLGYDNKNKQKCFNCEEGCKECTVNSDICTSCVDGYYLDKSNYVSKCLPCDKSCRICVEKSFYCISCKENFTLSKELTCVSDKYLTLSYKLNISFSEFGSNINKVMDEIRNTTLLMLESTVSTDNLVITLKELREYSFSDTNYFNTRKQVSSSGSETVLVAKIDHPEENVLNKIGDNFKVKNNNKLAELEVLDFLITDYNGTENSINNNNYYNYDYTNNSQNNKNKTNTETTDIEDEIINEFEEESNLTVVFVVVGILFNIFAVTIGVIIYIKCCCKKKPEEAPNADVLGWDQPNIRRIRAPAAIPDAKALSENENSDNNRELESNGMSNNYFVNQREGV